MKCIFLDFDGVINNWDCFNGVSVENALVLKQIIDLSGAKIIATTSNKYPIQNNNLDYYHSNFYNNYIRKLNDMGIEIYDFTPICDYNRTLEIKKYLSEHDVDQFVIIDDELIGKKLQDHQVFLDLYRGLQVEHIEPTLRILNGCLGFYPESYDRNETPDKLILRINKYYSKV